MIARETDLILFSLHQSNTIEVEREPTASLLVIRDRSITVRTPQEQFIHSNLIDRVRETGLQNWPRPCWLEFWAVSDSGEVLPCPASVPSSCSSHVAACRVARFDRAWLLALHRASCSRRTASIEMHAWPTELTAAGAFVDRDACCQTPSSVLCKFCSASRLKRRARG